MARRRQRRRREKERRHAPRPVAPPVPTDGDVDRLAERLVYSREQAAQALGVSLATLDRRVVPTIATVKTEWGARLIPAAELERYLAERTEQPRRPRRGAPPLGPQVDTPVGGGRAHQPRARTGKQPRRDRRPAQPRRHPHRPRRTPMVAVHGARRPVLGGAAWRGGHRRSGAVVIGADEWSNGEIDDER